MPATPFISYAQNGEDVLLWRALKQVEKGFYIDVGAQDPVNDSVTKAFYERGWHGINIEPVLHWFERLQQDRPHDTNLRLAVSDRPGSVRLFDVSGTGLSTADPEFAERHRAAGWSLNEFEVECLPLDTVLARHGVSTVHFLKIDCEGAEQAALQGLSLSEVRPWIILLEATEPNSTTPTWQQWEHLLTGRGYCYVYFDGLNRYYVATEHAELAESFSAPVNVFDHARHVSKVNTDAVVEQLNAEIERLRGANTVAHLQAQLSMLTADRDGLRNERDGLRNERDGLRNERDGLRNDRDGLRDEREGLGAELAILHGRIALIYGSRSWRVTAPLRWVTKSLKRLRGAQPAPPPAPVPLSREGGAANPSQAAGKFDSDLIMLRVRAAMRGDK